MGILSLAGTLVGWKRQESIGLTLDWYSVGSDVEIHYVRTQGVKNERETNTVISKTASKQYSYMPGDVEGIPEWMEVEWLYGLVYQPYDVPNRYTAEHANAKPAKARFDLRKMIPLSVIEEVLQDRDRKQLKLIFTFNDDKLDLRYEVYQWRK